MNCELCGRWMHGYLDNELDTVTATLVAGHLAQCAACRRHYNEAERLIAGVKEHAPYFDAPALLADEVFARVRAEAPASGRLRDKLRNWLVPSFSSLAIAASLALYIVHPAADELWVDEAVSSHVRSLMVGHLNDVASSDKHTVKPWFTGKLDFAPPVTDFAAQGYALQGGRLDYLQHQTAAALSYQHGKHVINAFILPSAEADSSPQQLTRRGYNIIAWRQGHMRFILVSDLNMTELAGLGQLVQKGM